MRYLICFFIFFVYNFSLSFKFFPIPTRYFFVLVGMYGLFKGYKKLRLTKGHKRGWTSLLRGVIFLWAIALFSALVNAYFDPHFFKYPVSIVLSLLSAYGVLVLFSYILKKEITQKLLLQMFVFTSLFQCVFSMFLFLTPSVKNIAFGLLSVSEAYEANIDHMIDGTVRVLSYGAGFFVAGITFALSLLFVAILYNSEEKGYMKLIYIVSALLISMIGSTISRTTLVGLPGFIVILLHSKVIKFSTIIKTGSLLAIVVISGISMFSKHIEGNSVFGQVFDRAFSIFYIYKETGTLQSTDSMTGSALYPDNTKTWVIGDGKMADPYNTDNTQLSYYKHVDIGLCRVLWGIGLLGFIAYSLVQLSLCRLCYLGRFESFVLFMYYIIFMLKGIVTLDVCISIFMMYHVYYNMQTNKRISSRHCFSQN